MHIAVAGQETDIEAGATCAQALSRVLSGKKMKAAVACRVAANGDERMVDLSAAVPDDAARLEPVDADSPEGLELIRHSAAHIMATAVKRLFPSVKVTIGPAIKDGFYYDFDYERPFTPDDLEAIEAEMKRIVAEDQPFQCRRLPRDEARKVFADMGEDYKLELLDDIEDAEIGVYANGDFTDMCRGPHIPATGALKAFKLTHVAGAYWRGDETRPMLQRIYGTAFGDEKALKKHLQMLEEAKKRDHRKLGAELDLFSFHEDAGPGFAIWHPKGMLARTILEDFERKEHLKRGYQIVQGPIMLKRDLWEQSGHYDNYRENMYFSEVEGQAYGVKPMNCLAHMLVYKSRPRSYRDLPIRLFELGQVHRHERSGVLHGLTRVRAFTQDDAHLICRPDQLQEEILGVLAFVRDVMGVFGFDYELELSTRPAKSIGSDADWDRATAALTEALEASGLAYDINEGDGAFYGPKIDVKLTDAIGRSWQCATVQCDFTLPERFDLFYTGADGERHRPVMLHRVILGSVERFMGILIEHYAGAFPTWLAPVQARVLSITDDQIPYVETVTDKLVSLGLRAEADTRNEKLGYKVREAQVAKIPYILVAGDQEKEAGGLNVRPRTGESLGLKTLDETVELITNDCQEPFKRGGMRYSF